MMMEAHGAIPNESTWTILALTCFTHEDIEKYVYSLQKYGSEIKVTAIETIVKNVLHRGGKDTFFILYNLIKYMQERQIRPVKEMIVKIDQYLRVYKQTVIFY